MPHLTFRAYRESDFPELEAMIFELYAIDNATTVGAMSHEQIVRTVHTMTHHPEVGDIVMFEIKDEVVGYAILTWFWSNEFGGRMLIIDELVVKASHRNKGFATQFFNWLFAERRYDEMAYELEVGAKRPDTLRFYERQGFQPFKTKHLFRKADV